MNSAVIKARGTNIRLKMPLICYFNTRITKIINSTLGIRFYLHGRFIDRSKTHDIFAVSIKGFVKITRIGNVTIPARQKTIRTKLC
jgi:hypothetical protein